MSSRYRLRKNHILVGDTSLWCNFPQFFATPPILKQYNQCRKYSGWKDTTPGKIQSQIEAVGFQMPHNIYWNISSLTTVRKISLLQRKWQTC